MKKQTLGPVGVAPHGPRREHSWLDTSSEYSTVPEMNFWLPRSQRVQSAVSFWFPPGQRSLPWQPLLLQLRLCSPISTLSENLSSSRLIPTRRRPASTQARPLWTASLCLALPGPRYISFYFSKPDYGAQRHQL